MTAEGNIIVGDFTPVDTRNTGGIHIRDSRGISFKSNSSQSASRNWRIRNDDYGWGNLDFSVGSSVNDWGDAATDVLLSLTSNRNVGINQTAPSAGWASSNSGVLHINATGSDNPGIHLTNSTTTTAGARGVDLSLVSGDGYLINRESNGGLYFRTDNTTRLFLTSDGVFSVWGAPTTGKGAFNIRPTTSEDSYIKFRPANEFDGSISGTAIDLRDAANANSKVWVSRASEYRFWTTSERMRLTTKGCLLLGSTNDAGELAGSFSSLSAGK